MSSIGNANSAQAQKITASMLQSLRMANNRQRTHNDQLETFLVRLTGSVPPHSAPLSEGAGKAPPPQEPSVQEALFQELSLQMNLLDRRDALLNALDTFA